MPEKDDSVEQLVSVPSELEASAIVAVLEEEGIRAMMVGGLTAGFRAEVPGNVTVLVMKSDLERAKAILEDLEAEA